MRAKQQFYQIKLIPKIKKKSFRSDLRKYPFKKRVALKKFIRTEPDIYRHELTTAMQHLLRNLRIYNLKKKIFKLFKNLKKNQTRKTVRGKYRPSKKNPYCLIK